MTIRVTSDELFTLAAASRSSFCFCNKDSMDSGSAPGAIVAALPVSVSGGGKSREATLLYNTFTSKGIILQR
jgi:hypothetical protein